MHLTISYIWSDTCLALILSNQVSIVESAKKTCNDYEDIQQRAHSVHTSVPVFNSCLTTKYSTFFFILKRKKKKIFTNFSALY